MDIERRDRAQDLLQAALLRPPQERTRFLDGIGAVDARLRREVERLLAAHAEHPGAASESPAVETSTRTDIWTERDDGNYQRGCRAWLTECPLCDLPHPRLDVDRLCVSEPGIPRRLHRQRARRARSADRGTHRTAGGSRTARPARQTRPSSCPRETSWSLGTEGPSCIARTALDLNGTTEDSLLHDPMFRTFRTTRTFRTFRTF